MCRTAVHDSFKNQWECEAASLNMSSSALFNQVIIREREAPAEPMRRQLGRSLALPLAIRAFPLAIRAFPMAIRAFPLATTDELNWSRLPFVFIPYPNQLMT